MGSRDGGRASAEEQELIARMRGGDEEAFASFAASYLPALYRFALRRLGNDRELAQEIAQETVVKVIERFDSFRGEAALFTWICACCRNEIAGHFRRRARRPVEVELRAEAESVMADVLPLAARRPLGPEQRLIEIEHRELVHLALDRLPKRYAEAMEWRYVDELSVGEIAARWTCTYKAAESTLSRSRAAFLEVYLELERGLADGAAPTGEREESLG